MGYVNARWRLIRRPSGAVETADFEWSEEMVPALEPGELLVRQLYLSLDPTNRVWAASDSYLPAVELGQVMRGIGLGRVEESRHERYRPGDLVQGQLGWQRFEVTDGRGLTAVPALPGVDPAMFLHVLGHIGLTAWAGVVVVGALQPGETLVVTAAAGAVGSLAGQIGKQLGARVVGIAGTPAKCEWITGELGFDAAIDYRREAVRARLRALCPRGVDVHFENVGGTMLEAGLANLARGGRIALCGLISQYAAREVPTGPWNLHELIFKRGRIQGFLVMDYMDRAGEAFGQLAKWLAEGRLKARFTIVDGLQQAPSALNRLFDGSHDGKLLVRLL